MVKFFKMVNNNKSKIVKMLRDIDLFLTAKNNKADISFQCHLLPTRVAMYPPTAVDHQANNGEENHFLLEWK